MIKQTLKKSKQLLRFCNIITVMAGDYKKLLNKHKNKKIYANTKTMGVNIDKNEYYEIILSNSAHPEKMNYSNHT